MTDTPVTPQVSSGLRSMTLRNTTDRISDTENPVTAEISTGTSALNGWPLAMVDALRTSAAPPQPALCRFQNARFLSEKKGFSPSSSTAIVII
jgi:hypothetical protein